MFDYDNVPFASWVSELMNEANLNQVWVGIVKASNLYKVSFVRPENKWSNYDQVENNCE